MILASNQSKRSDSSLLSLHILSGLGRVDRSFEIIVKVSGQMHEMAEVSAQCSVSVEQRADMMISRVKYK